MADLNWDHATCQLRLPQIFICQFCRWRLTLLLRRWYLVEDMLLRVTQNDPFFTTTRELFAQALDAHALNAQLHEPVRDFRRSTFDFTPETDDKSDDFALDLFQGSRRREENQGQMQLVCKRERLLSQGFDRWSGHGNGSNSLLMQALQQVGQGFIMTAQ